MRSCALSDAKWTAQSRQMSALEAQLEVMRKQAAGLETQSSAMRQEKAELEARLRDATTALQESQSAQSCTVGELQSALKEQAAMQSRLKAARSTIDQLEGQLADMRAFSGDSQGQQSALTEAINLRKAAEAECEQLRQQLSWAVAQQPMTQSNAKPAKLEPAQEPQDCNVDNSDFEHLCLKSSGSADGCVSSPQSASYDRGTMSLSDSAKQIHSAANILDALVSARKSLDIPGTSSALPMLRTSWPGSKHNSQHGHLDERATCKDNDSPTIKPTETHTPAGVHNLRYLMEGK